MNPYNTLLTKIILPLGDFAFGKKYLKVIKDYQTYDEFSEKKLHDLQQNNLKKMLGHTLYNVPYYKTLDIKEQQNTEKFLQSFPILTKNILREKVDQLIAKGYEKEELDKNHSSGSSGVQSVTYMTTEHRFYVRALQTHWWKYSGFSIGDRILQLGISPNRTFPKNLKDIFFRTTYVNAFSLDDSDIKQVISDVISKNIKFIIGYPSAINCISEYLNNENQTISIKGIISLGDKLFDHQKNNFVKSFENPKIIDTYGCAEGLLIAATAEGNYYHVMSPHVYIEIVDDDGQEVPDGEMGHVLVTCLTNSAMPLIRYKLGDLAIKLPLKDYPKNRKFHYPLLKKIVGRETDVIKTPQGKNLIVHSFTGIFEYFQEIKQFKVIAEKEILTILYIENEPIPSETIEELRKKLVALTGPGMQIKFKKVETISATASGKPQIIEIKK